MIISSRVLAGVALTALLAGCGEPASADEVALAADGTEVMMSSQQSTYLGNVVFASVTRGDPVQAAGEVAKSTTALWPSGCATSARDAADPHVVRVTLNDCTGPFGLVHLDGDEVVTFSVGAQGGLHAEILGVNLTAGGRPATYAATADLTLPGTTRDVAWQGSWSRVNAAGGTVDHTWDLNLDLDPEAGCRTANGTSRTDVRAREIDTTISDYKVCRNADGQEGCPTGTVTHIGRLSGRAVTVAFDSTDTAEVTGPLGHRFAVSLVCPAADGVGR